jgi:alkanesulfonate monooxygenase SsuD/methylene tetrahydromethanopterin reductase-like flavin-dependent oxidoreductase (luciferase family)
VSYVVTPEMYREALQTIAAAADAAGRDPARFDTAHLLFFRIDESFEAAWDVATTHLSERYASDFRGPAKKYCALGQPADIAARIDAFRAAGVRHLILDAVSPAAERHAQVEWFAAEVLPLLR